MKQPDNEFARHAAARLDEWAKGCLVGVAVGFVMGLLLVAAVLEPLR